MNKKILFGLLVLLMLLLIPMMAVQGKGKQPPTPQPSSGGAAADPYPVPLTPEQQKILVQKIERLEKIKSLKAKGISPGEIREQLNSPTDTTLLVPQNLLSSDDIGYLS